MRGVFHISEPEASFSVPHYYSSLMKYFFVNRCSKWECTRNAGAYENPPHVSSPLKIFTSPDSSSAMEIEGIKNWRQWNKVNAGQDDSPFGEIFCRSIACSNDCSIGMRLGRLLPIHFTLRLSSASLHRYRFSSQPDPIVVL